MRNEACLIFCQSPGDIPYVLKTYEDEYQRGNKITILVVNVYNNYLFLRELKLELEDLLFIPYKLYNLKQIFKYPLEIRRVKKFCNIYLKKYKFTKFYFYSVFCDWLTFSILNQICTRNSDIIYVDYHDSLEKLQRKSFIQFKYRIYIFLLYLLSNRVYFDFDIEGQTEYRFKIENYKFIKTKKATSINLDTSKYFIEVPLKTDRNILLFANCYYDFFRKESFYKTYKAILNIFHSYDYNIVIKYHPREGKILEIDSLKDLEYPIYIPAEFINPTGYKFIFGLQTSCLNYFTNNSSIPTYSLINLFESSDNEQINYIRNYLLINTNNKIKFINSFEQLKEVLEENK